MWKKVLLGIAGFIVFIIVLSLILTSSIADVANKQLKALRQGDMITAYSFTSRDFRANTSLDKFKKFVNANPSLKNNLKSSWSERSISNGLGTLKGNLIATDGAVTPVEYRLVKENKEWKIMSLVLQPTGVQTAPVKTVNNNPAPVATASDLARGEIVKVLVNSAQNSAGNVDVNKDVIEAKVPKIYVSTYTLHAVKGLKITAELVYVTNGSKIGPISSTVSKDGNIITDFSFTNTAASWPVGDYKINISTSNNQQKSVSFRVK